jgi:nucleotide-binding universal stress UspA family protein
MASHGRTGLARLAVGSVTEEVVRRNPTGTVVVGPHGARFALARERATALLCTDGSEQAARAAPHAARLAHLLGLGTTIVQRVDPDEDITIDGGPPPRPLLEAAREHCGALERYFASRQLTADSRVVFGETTGSIVHTAETVPATLIAMASHGRTGFGRFSLGSTAATVVQSARCPVFVVGPAAITNVEDSGP